MRHIRYILALAVALLLPLSAAAQKHVGAGAGPQPKRLATFVPARAVLDFGTILEQNGKTSRVITFTNRGRKPVTISDVRTYCGCAAPSFTRKPILPGKTGQVTITYDPYNRPGRFSKDVYVLLNDGRQYQQVRMQGQVSAMRHAVTEEYPYSFGRGLYMSMEVLPFSCTNVGVAQQVVVGIANDTDRPMTVTFSRRPNNRVLKMPARIKLQPRQRTTFTASYAFPRAYTYDRHIWLRIRVDGHPVRSMKVRFYGTGRQNNLHI